ncbi:MAG: DUF1684 domain-containing protein [Candidatus Marinimicrobia bacterium]|nr:DUF1684 domain-containing protein [Candidatus Neomarinimicrobiota bacterium]
MINTEFWSKSLKMQRKHKDEFFKTHYQSPIHEEDQLNFKGLDYYEPDINYRFELKLSEFEDHPSIEINDSKGQVRKMLVWGEFHFEIQGVKCTLQAYKSEADEERLFIPYKDLTNGSETYGAGRYLDLYDEEDLLDTDQWILDFNNSTNPWCAYNEDYACPLVPRANWLNIAIKAGEKAFSLSSH